MKTIKIAIYKGNSRYRNIFNSLNLIKSDILNKIKNKDNIVIKPNCVSDTNQLASVHVDVIRALLDFLKPYKKRIIIAEGSAYSTQTAFRNLNYLSLKNKYNIEFKDLNNDKYEEINGFDYNFKPIKLGISKTLLESDCIISIALLKTHDSAITTLGIKNIAVGGLIKKSLFTFRIPIPILRQLVNRLTSIRNDKAKIHQGAKAINRTIFEIYKRVRPDISIIDGFVGMEGNGPIDGTPVKMNLAISGTNAIATDVIGARLMGLSPENIGYLNYIINHENFDPSKIKIIGNTTIEKEKRKFKLHENIKSQINWKIDK